MMDYMNEAIREAYEGIKKHHGGPFGAVIVRDGKIIGRGHNCVLLRHDPTCHGEVEAVRDACRNIGSGDLSGCDLYTTAAPCPMCRGAILWANISRVFYGCSVEDTDKIGFRDQKFYDDWDCFESSCRQSGLEACRKLFEDYEKTDAERY